MRRIVEPEILDHLDPENPLAVASRRDLGRLNRIMGHPSIIASAICEFLHPGLPPTRRWKVAELGGGDGTLLLRIARRLSALGVAADVQLVDRHPHLSTETLIGLSDLGWTVDPIGEEAVGWLAESDSDFDLIFANLFLHHFGNSDLRSIFASAAGTTRSFLACEPRRSSFSGCASKAVGFIGCNWVTRNDAAISVRAGFAGTELTEIWPEAQGWRLIERRAGAFSHLFVGVKE